MSQVSNLLEFLLEPQTKPSYSQQLDSVLVVGTGRKSFENYHLKSLPNCAKYHDVSKVNTVGYRAALISKHTAAYRQSAAQFVGVLLESLNFHFGFSTTNLKGEIQLSIIARRNLDHNLLSQMLDPNGFGFTGEAWKKSSSSSQKRQSIRSARNTSLKLGSRFPIQ